MSILVDIALLGWVPVVLLLFAVLPPRRAVLAAFLIAWMFLPMAGYRFEGLPNYTKMSATTLGVLLGTLLFDPNRLLSFRLRWFDLPMVAWCMVPFIASVTNSLGMYDGISAVADQMISWGFPYLIGRMYFSDPAGLRELAVGMFIGGLVYIPFCLYEIRMSPQLHRMVYGYHAHSFAQTYRFGGWRPTVFMQHGLMVGMWMTAASLVGVWLWKTGALKRLWGIPMVWLVPPLLVTTLLCKSSLALLLLLVGITVLFMTHWTRTTIAVLCLLAMPPIYVIGRTTGEITGNTMVSFAEGLFGGERAQSLAFRLRHEDELADKAKEQFWFGWGGWGRYRITDEGGRDVSVTDSLWIITFGRYGVAGLIALMGVLLLPAFLLWWHHPAGHWSHPVFGAAAGLGLLLVLYTMDHLLNAMVNPVFMLAAGGVIGVDAAMRAKRRVRRRPAAAPAPAYPTAAPPVAASRMAHP